MEGKDFNSYKNACQVDLQSIHQEELAAHCLLLFPGIFQELEQDFWVTGQFGLSMIAQQYEIRS